MRRERRSLGPGGTKGVASLISGMTLRERRQLHEAIKRRILQEDADDNNAFQYYVNPNSPGKHLYVLPGPEYYEYYFFKRMGDTSGNLELGVQLIHTPNASGASREGLWQTWLEGSSESIPTGMSGVKSNGFAGIVEYATGNDSGVSDAVKEEILDFVSNSSSYLPSAGVGIAISGMMDLGAYAQFRGTPGPPSQTQTGAAATAGSSGVPTAVVQVGRPVTGEVPPSDGAVTASAQPVTAASSAAPAPPPTATAQGGPSYIGADTGSGVYKIPDKPIVASESPIGLEIFDSAGNILMVKTQQGWRIRAKLADDEVLAMVVPAAREEVAKGLRLRDPGQEYDILKRNLIDQTNANKETELTLRREGNYWIDPFPINDEKAQQIIDQLGDALRVKRDVRELQVTTDKLYLGDAYFVFDGNTVTIKIPYSENNAGFVDIFGADKNIDAAIAKTQRRIGKDKPLKIPVAGATERSIIRMMTPSILGPLGIGAITFTPDESGTYTSKPITMNAEQLNKFRELFSSVNR